MGKTVEDRCKLHYTQEEINEIMKDQTRGTQRQKTQIKTRSKDTSRTKTQEKGIKKTLIVLFFA
jgi:hypothetical protein